jgi:hypothetical protein
MDAFREWEICLVVSGGAGRQLGKTHGSGGLALAPHAHALHALLQRLLRVCFELAEGYATVLVVGGHLLPLLDLGHASGGDGGLRVCNSLAGGHVADLDEGDGNQARPAQARNGLCDEPLGVRLRDDDDGLALLCLELVGPLGLEVVDDDAVDHGALLAGARQAHRRRHHAVHAVHVERVGGARDALLIARVVRLLGRLRLRGLLRC